MKRQLGPVGRARKLATTLLSRFSWSSSEQYLSLLPINTCRDQSHHATRTSPSAIKIIKC